MFLILDVLVSKQVTVKFVQDTSKFWYKPDIAREQGDHQILCFFIKMFSVY